MKLAFHKGDAVLSRIIEYGTHGPYSHVELVFSDGLSFSARAELNPAVNIITPDFSDQLWDFIEIPAKYPEQPARAWAELQKGKGYDWAADFAFPMPWIKDDTHKLMCASSCTLALQQAGLFRDFLPSQVSPVQLAVMAKVLNEVTC